MSARPPAPVPHPGAAGPLSSRSATNPYSAGDETTAHGLARNASRDHEDTRHDDRVHDWPRHAAGDVPSPRLVAAWLALDMLPTEHLPRWAAFWLVDGYDGAALVELAGLHGDDPREVRDV